MSQELQHALTVLAIALAAYLDRRAYLRRLQQLERRERARAERQRTNGGQRG